MSSTFTRNGQHLVRRTKIAKKVIGLLDRLTNAIDFVKSVVKSGEKSGPCFSGELQRRTAVQQVHRQLTAVLGRSFDIGQVLEAVLHRLAGMWRQVRQNDAVVLHSEEPRDAPGRGPSHIRQAGGPDQENLVIHNFYVTS